MVMPERIKYITLTLKSVGNLRQVFHRHNTEYVSDFYRIVRCNFYLNISGFVII